MLRWRCYIEEYHPRLFYIEGKSNILADDFSQLPREDNHNTQAKELDILFVEDWDKECCRQNPAVAFSHLGSEPIWNKLVESTDESFFGNAIMDKVMLRSRQLKSKSMSAAQRPNGK